MSREENKSTKVKDHTPVFRMECVWYPTDNPERDLLIKHNGDMEAWAKAIHQQLEAHLFKPFCKVYIWQLEKGENAGKFHCQIYIEVWEKTRTLTLAGSIGSADKLNGITIREASIAGKNAIRYYCGKEKTRQAGPFSNQPLSIMTAPTEWDLKEIESSPYPWQKDMIGLMRAKCSDDRKIHWVYDPQGCSGKTKLIKFLCAKKLAIPVQYGSARDLMNVLYNNKGSNAYVFDLTRAKPDSMPGDDIYSTMEAAKNGMVQNTKYETGWAVFDPPHIVIFANVKPEFQKLTRDRWQVWCIDDAARLVQWHKKGDTPVIKARRLTATNQLITLSQPQSAIADADPAGGGVGAAAASSASLRSPSCASAAPRGAVEARHRQLGPDEESDSKALTKYYEPNKRSKEATEERAKRQRDEDEKFEVELYNEWENKRKDRWDKYWEEVEKKWNTHYHQQSMDVRGVACYHNLWGCVDCDPITRDEQNFEPPSLKQKDD